MKHFNKTILVFTLTASCSLICQAQTFTSGDFNFTVLSSEDKTVSIGQSQTKLIGDIVLPSTVQYEGEEYKVTALSKVAFAYCSSINSFTVPEGVDSIGEYAFWKSNVKSVNLPNSVKTISLGAFWDCLNLTKVVMPESLEVIEESMFYGCENLYDFNMPSGVKKIRNFAFKNCTKLDIEQLPAELESVGEAAFMSSALQEITIPEGTDSIGASAFSCCQLLTTANISSTVTSMTGSAFSACPSLESINVSSNNPILSSIDGVLYNKEQTQLLLYPNHGPEEYIAPPTLVSVESMAFEMCDRLKSATFGNNLEILGERAFNNCFELNKVVLPASLKSIGYWAFSNTNSLDTLECMAVTPPDCEDSSFYGMFIDDCVLVVPEGSAEQYSKAREWKKFNEVIERKYSNITETSQTNPTILKYDSSVLVGNIPCGTVISVYNITGQIKDRFISESNTVLIPFALPGIYIMEFMGHTYKIQI